MRLIFIAGTDTGVGKTFITKRLAKFLAAEGYRVAVQKWVETGVKKSKAVYSFKLAASPHLAAKSEGKAIKITKIKTALKDLSEKADIVIVEGTGGLMVPLTEKTFLIDLVKELKIPVLLVAANRIGAINHTLLTIEALRIRKIKVLGVIFNSVSPKENRLVADDNPKIVKKFIGKIPVWISGWQKT